jgi:hypothetical protein
MAKFLKIIMCKFIAVQRIPPGYPLYCNNAGRECNFRLALESRNHESGNYPDSCFPIYTLPIRANISTIIKIVPRVPLG